MDSNLKHYKRRSNYNLFVYLKLMVLNLEVKY
jgi:hypothetical protein